MGAIAILSDAVIWAASGTFLTAKLAKIDFLTIVTFRALFAVAFVVPAIFVLGSQGELWHMDPNTVWQLALAGLLAYVVAEPAYTLTLSFLGLTRGYTAVIGLNSVGSFVLPAIFLGEAIGWRDALGGLIIISGVYLVAFYGRAAVPTLDPATMLRQPPSFTLGSARPNLRPGGRRRSRLPFLARPFSSPPFPPSPVSSAEEPVRPIAGGSAAAAAGSNAAATRVRIPGLGITLPRLVVGLIIAFITALGWSGDATVLRAVSPGLDAAPVALMQLWPAMLIFVLWLTIARRGRPHVGLPSKGTTTLIGTTGALTTGLGTMLVIVSVQDIGAGPTAVLFAMSTIFALPLGVIFLKERVTRWGFLGVGVAVAGVTVLAI